MADPAITYYISTDAAENRVTAHEGNTVLMPMSIVATAVSGGFDISAAIDKLTTIYMVLMETLQVSTDEYVGVYDATEKKLKLIKVADGGELTETEVTVKVLIVGDLK